jgi:RimJ/RimL family protein N-acetyltransferase
MLMESERRNDAPGAMLSDDVVILRPWSPPDARFIADASSDPGIQRYSSPPQSVTDAVALIESFERNWLRFAERGKPSGVSFAILDAASNDLAGQCGVDEWSNADVAQIGYWLAPHARGRGFATRAVKLLTSWLFELGAARVFLTSCRRTRPRPPLPVAQGSRMREHFAPTAFGRALGAT